MPSALVYARDDGRSPLTMCTAVPVRGYMLHLPGVCCILHRPGMICDACCTAVLSSATSMTALCSQQPCIYNDVAIYNIAVVDASSGQSVANAPLTFVPHQSTDVFLVGV